MQYIRDIQELCLLSRKWLPPITEDDKTSIWEAIHLGTPWGTGFIRNYVEKIYPYLDSIRDKSRLVETLVSGCAFYYASLLFIMHYPNWASYQRGAFLLNVLYILVDHYIDSIDITQATKQQALSQMYFILGNPAAIDTIEVIDDSLYTITKVYVEFIQLHPSAQGALFELFNQEATGMIVQASDRCSRETYMTIAEKKGGCTLNVLHSIVTGSTRQSNEVYEIGVCMQLLDDMLDVTDDIANKINTIATHDLQHDGHLDLLWTDTMRRILMLDSKFVIFIIVYTMLAMYIPGRVPSAFSENLRMYTSLFNLFEKCNGIDALGDSIITELIFYRLARNRAV
jgi:hypothetical protein